MKKRNLLSGLFLAALMSLGLATILPTPAHAEDDWTCIEGGNPPPADGLDGVNIIGNGSSPDVCTLGDLHVKNGIGIAGFKTIVTGNLTADNTYISIALDGSESVTTGKLTAGTNIAVVGAVNLGKITAGTSGNGSVQVYGGNAGLATGAISNTNGFVFVTSKFTIKIPSITNTNGDVRLFANYQQTSGVAQKIGSGGIGAITISSGSGNGIYISNPYDIDYSGSNILQPTISSNPGGYVILDTGHWTGAAPDGTNSGVVTLTGSINVDDPSAAGFIDIFALEIVAKGATLSASSPSGQVGTINLVTDALTNKSGLTINVNGNNTSQTIDLSIFPIGSYGVVYASSITQPIFFTDFTPSAAPLTIEGNGDFAISANGNNNGIKIFGYPLKIRPKTTTITNNGSGNLVTIQGTDGGDQLNTLKWGGVVQIHANNTATGQNANLIELKATDIPDITQNVVLDASGGTGTANGSNISVTTTTGNLSIGGLGGNETLNADGGQTGGSAGEIVVTNSGGNISVLKDSLVSASVPSSSGDGGRVSLTAGTPTNKGKITVSGTVKADAGFSGGSGRQIFLKYADPGTANGVIVNGVLSNNVAGTALPGSIIFQNQVDTAVLAAKVNVTGLVQAINAQIRFVQPAGSVKVTSEGTTPGGAIVGHLYGFAKEVTVNIPVEGPVSSLVIEHLEATEDDVTVNAPRTRLTILSTDSDVAVTATKNVKLIGSGVDIGLNSSLGKDSIQGLMVSIESLNDNINVGSDVRADDQIKIKATGNGNILSSGVGTGGTIGSRNPGQSTTLIISTEEGRIGDNVLVPFSKPILTAVTNLIASNTSNSNGASINIRNVTSNAALLRIANTASGGDFQVESNGSVQVGNVNVANGSIAITADSGELRVRSSAVLIATEGNIGLANSDEALGTIVIAPGAYLKATTTSTDRFFRGNVLIHLGASATPSNNHSNLNVIVYGDPNFVDFGNVGITALASDPANSATAFNRTIGFDAKTRMGAIRLLGNVSITAQGN